MGGQNAGRTNITLDDWMRDVEKRTMHEERRPQIRSAADLLGPGIGPTSVQLLDWNDEATLFNGFYWSAPGALHAPDASPSGKFWMGYNEVAEDGSGFQKVYEFRGQSDDSVMTSYTRRLLMVSGVRTWGPWIASTSSGGGGGGSSSPSVTGLVGISTYAANFATGATSATYVDSPLAVTFTAVAGHSYRVTMTTLIRSSVDTRIFIALREGSTELWQALVQQPPVGNLRTARTHVVDGLSFSAGAHTVKVSFALAGGTGTVNMDGAANYVNVLSVEDVTLGGGAAQGQVPGGYAQVIANTAQNTTTTPADIAGLSVTVSLSSLRRYRVTFRGTARSTVTSDRVGLFVVDGATQIMNDGVHVSSLANLGTPFTLERILIAPADGSHTIKCQIAQATGATGGVFLGAASVNVNWLMVEDIGVA